MQISDLLKRSLISKAPLTGICFNSAMDRYNDINNAIVIKTEDLPFINESEEVISLKLLVSKAEKKVLCAEAGEDFADLVLSYLTLPLGSVIKLLDVNSSIGCVENLYRSVQGLSSDYIKSDECRDMLLSPKLAPFFGYSKQLLKIDEMPPKRGTETGRCSTCKWNNTLCKHGVDKSVFIELNPKLPSGKSEQGGGYAKGPGKFMVTNDLHVSPLTPVSTTQFISSQGLPFSKLEEKEANIDLPQVRIPQFISMN